MKKRTFHIPVFVPHKGCPHTCVFCNQRTITGQVCEMSTENAKAIIEMHLKSIESHYDRDSSYIEIAFFGGSFTAIDMESQTKLLALAHSFVSSGRADGIRLSTRPDAIDDVILSNCKRYSVTAIELGVQSALDDVLKLSERGHSFDDVKKAATLIKKYNIELGLQMMTGLPGDTHEKSIETAQKLAMLSPKCVRIYPTLVMDGTRLMEMYLEGSYTPQSLDSAVTTAADAAEIFIKNGIEILRISLQTTDGINEKTTIGPYHPSFAELVYSLIEKRKLERYINENAIKDTVLKVQCDPYRISRIIGHKKVNKLYLKQKYNIDLEVKTV